MKIVVQNPGVLVEAGINILALIGALALMVVMALAMAKVRDLSLIDDHREPTTSSP